MKFFGKFLCVEAALFGAALLFSCGSTPSPQSESPSSEEKPELIEPKSIGGSSGSIISTADRNSIGSITSSASQSHSESQKKPASDSENSSKEGK